MTESIADGILSREDIPDMFCVIYEFKIKPGHSEQFEQAWSDFTEAIHRVCGSLGSRLHKTSDPFTYVAYAQWPSKEVFERKIPQEAYSKAEWSRREAMTSALENSKKIYELEMSHDRLRPL